ncbi:MAG: hypothetical protein RPT25_07020 [Cycloclasticus sp.]|jgi:Phage integrase family.
MPRKRSNSRDNWLPSRVYRGKSQYEYRPKEGGCIKLGKIERDAQGKPVETDKTKHDVFAAHARAKAASVIREDMKWLLKLYMGSVQWAKLSDSQRESDTLRLKRIKPVFGKMMPRDITSGHIRKYMDALHLKKNSASSPNKDHGFLSRLFNWSIERDYMRLNPCEKVTKFPETPRDRYIEDWEYDLVYEVAEDSSYPWIASMMEFSYLCRMRGIEVRAMTEERNILEDGVFVERAKSSVNEITAWSPRLAKALDDARKKANPSAPIRIKDKPVFKSKSGGHISATSLKSGWRRVREIAKEDGLEINGVIVKLKESFTFHDIKAKGITDHADKSGGHRSKKMQAVYDRKPSIIKATR